jgi:plastocyanin
LYLPYRARVVRGGLSKRQVFVISEDTLMRLRPLFYAFVSIPLLLLGSTMCLAANVVVSVGGTSTGSDGYGGTYSNAVLQFSPSSVTINAGDTVTFNGMGGAAHNVHADDNSFRCANGCDGVNGGDGTPSSAAWTSTVTFNTPGVVQFHCDNHATMGMVGTITVNAVAAPAFTIKNTVSGPWYNPDQGGHGFNIQLYPPNLFVAFWYVYNPDGNQQVWIQAAGTYDPTSNTTTVPAQILDGAKFPPNFIKTDLTATPWGTMTFTFTDCKNATVAWDSTVAGFGSGSLALTKIIDIDGLACTD